MPMSESDHSPPNKPTNQKVGKYLELIRRRACGEVLTTAAWVREFVQRHPEYQVSFSFSEWGGQLL